MYPSSLGFQPYDLHHLEHFESPPLLELRPHLICMSSSSAPGLDPHLAQLRFHPDCHHHPTGPGCKGRLVCGNTAAWLSSIVTGSIFLMYLNALTNPPSPLNPSSFRRVLQSSLLLLLPVNTDSSRNSCHPRPRPSTPGH